MIKSFSFLIFLLTSLQVTAGVVPSPAAEGALFQRALLTAIDQAIRVVVREHSDPMDFYAGGETLPDVPEKTYVKVELTAIQKQRFASLLRTMSPVTQDAFPACIPEYHHTIEFIDKARRARKLKVCFRCGQLEFDGVQASPPASIYTTLSIFTQTIGMTPKRDWEKLSRAKAPPQARNR